MAPDSNLNSKSAAPQVRDMGMQTPFTHPSSMTLLGEVNNLLHQKQVYSRPDHRIIFICGGPISRAKGSVRARFLGYANKNLKQYRFLLAETASKDLIETSSEPRFLNLTEFETLIAEISDCVIIIPESPGSYAELGCFSVSTEIRRKILVVAKNEFQDESFINNGPIDLIDRNSAFKSVLLPKGYERGFKFVKQRLEAKLTFKSGKRIDLAPESPKPLKIVLYLSYELVRIFRLLTLEDVKKGISQILGAAQDEQCRYVISVLYAAKYLKRSRIDSDYFAVRDVDSSFLDIRHADIFGLIAKSTGNINKQLPHLVEILNGEFE